MKKIVSTIGTVACLAMSVLADPPATAPANIPATNPVPDVAVVRPAGPVNRAAVLNGLMLNGNMGGRSLESQRRRLAMQQQSVEGLPVDINCKQDELLRFSLADGLLQVDILPENLQMGQTRIGVEGSNATWIAQLQTVGFPAGTYINLNRFDFDQTEEGQIWSVSLHRSDSYLSLNAQGLGSSISFHQSNGVAMLIVMQLQNGRNRPVLRLDGPSLLQLQADHPEEVRQYLTPILSRLGGSAILRPGAADVYSVFSELPDSSVVKQKFNELLPKLDSEAFPERDAASAQLARLGSAGVKAALHLKRDNLSFEQTDRIDALIDRERHRLIEDPTAARRDSHFLLDCLEDIDPAVRVAAKTELEKVVGHALIFDPTAHVTARATAVEDIRAQLKQESEAKAATQPN